MMSFLRSLRSGAPRLPVAIDGHHATLEGLAAFQARDWDEVARIAAGQSADGASVLIQSMGLTGMLDEPFGVLPEEPVARTVVGGMLVMWGWRHRGFGRGEDVEEARIEPFLDRLDTAAAALVPAVQADAQAGPAVAFLIRAATGLGDLELLDWAEERFFGLYTPPLIGGAWLIQARGAKWHGDHAQMASVTERIARNDNVHPARLGMAARNLIERWLYDTGMQPDPVLAEQVERLFLLDETKDIVRRWHSDYERLLDVWSEPDPFAERFAHDNIGVASYLADLRELARHHVQALGTTPSDWPWCYVARSDDPVEAWRMIRRDVGLRG